MRAWVGSAVLVAACSGGGAGEVIQAPVATVSLPGDASRIAPPTTAPAPAAPGDAFAPYAGRYRITGSPQSDGCGGALYLAARHIEVAPPRLQADVVNRTYGARVRDDRSALVAEGDFDVPSWCPGGKMHEQWTLAPSGDGLDGVLVSEWPLPPDCENRCRVVFSIHAERLGAREKN